MFPESKNIHSQITNTLVVLSELCSYYRSRVIVSPLRNVLLLKKVQVKGVPHMSKVLYSSVQGGRAKMCRCWGYVVRLVKVSTPPRVFDHGVVFPTEMKCNICSVLWPGSLKWRLAKTGWKGLTCMVTFHSHYIESNADLRQGGHLRLRGQWSLIHRCSPSLTHDQIYWMYLSWTPEHMMVSDHTGLCCAVPLPMGTQCTLFSIHLCCTMPELRTVKVRSNY